MLALGIDCATRSGCALVDRSNKRERVVDHSVVDLSGKSDLHAGYFDSIDEASAVYEAARADRDALDGAGATCCS